MLLGEIFSIKLLPETIAIGAGGGVGWVHRSAKSRESLGGSMGLGLWLWAPSGPGSPSAPRTSAGAQEV